MVDSPWYILVWMIHLIPELLANFQGFGFVLNKCLSPKGLLDWDGVFSWPDFLVPRKIQKGKGQKKISVPTHSVLLFGSHALLHRRGPSSQEALQSSSTGEQCYLRVADSVWTEKEVEMEMKVEGANRPLPTPPQKTLKVWGQLCCWFTLWLSWPEGDADGFPQPFQPPFHPLQEGATQNLLLCLLTQQHSPPVANSFKIRD